MTKEEFRDYVEFLRSQDEISYDVYSGLIDGIDTLEQQPCYNPNEWCHDCSEYDQEKHCCPRYNKVIRTAVEEMKQEPCEDAVSRKAVINQIFYSTDNSGDVVLGSALRKRIARLPSVAPQEPKTGHWIEGQTDNPNIHNILCSCCFEGYPSKGHANSQYTKEKFQWCPKCGARMVESQAECEDKE